MTVVVQEKGYYGDQRFWGKEDWLKELQSQEVVQCELANGKTSYGIVQEDGVVLVDKGYEGVGKKGIKLTGERVRLSEVRRLATL